MSSKTETAAAWVSQFPDTPSRAPALENLVAIWTTRDPAAVNDWLRDLALTAHSWVLRTVATPLGSI